MPPTQLLMDSLDAQIKKFQGSAPELDLRQKARLDAWLELLSGDKQKTAENTPSRQSARRRGSEAMVDVYNSIGREVFLLCCLTSSVTGFTDYKRDDLIGDLKDWWKLQAPYPQPLIDMASVLHNVTALTALGAKVKKGTQSSSMQTTEQNPFQHKSANFNLEQTDQQQTKKVDDGQPGPSTRVRTRARRDDSESGPSTPRPVTRQRTRPENPELEDPDAEVYEASEREDPDAELYEASPQGIPELEQTSSLPSSSAPQGYSLFSGSFSNQASSPPRASGSGLNQPSDPPQTNVTTNPPQTAFTMNTTELFGSLMAIEGRGAQDVQLITFHGSGRHPSIRFDFGSDLYGTMSVSPALKQRLILETERWRRNLRAAQQ